MPMCFWQGYSILVDEEVVVVVVVLVVVAVVVVVVEEVVVAVAGKSIVGVVDSLMEQPGTCNCWCHKTVFEVAACVGSIVGVVVDAAVAVVVDAAVAVAAVVVVVVVAGVVIGADYQRVAFAVDTVTGGKMFVVL